MKFVVSSTDLLNHLTAISKVISTKSTMPILDNFLFDLAGSTVTITASDLESTVVTWMELENVEGNGQIAVPAKLLLDTLKEFSEQPLTFQMNPVSFAIDIFSENGKYSIVGQNGEDFPQLPTVNEQNSAMVEMSHDALLSGIVKTVFATADDELRPVMNGVFVALTPDDCTFVASDAHKLVRYKRSDIKANMEASFILPKKPANLLKSLLPKENFDVKVEFDDKFAFFNLTSFKVICRLTEGKYPGYNSVIPTKNPNKMQIDRSELYNSLRRVAVFSNQANNLIRLKIQDSQLVVSAQDADYSISAVERLNCQYEGEEMEIGFKSAFMLEILSNISSTDIVLEMSDPARAGIFLPVEKDSEDEDVLMLLMPMMLNS